MTHTACSGYLSEAMVIFVLWIFSLGIVLLFAFLLVGLVEEWSYGKNQKRAPQIETDAE